MIRYWLHCDPENDVEVWREQLRQALWIEKRNIKTLARIIGGKDAGA